jgi:TonB-linked SusC/RagA family outer membrane protein
MKRITSMLVCLLLFGFAATFAQDIQIKGTVTASEDGTPIPGVYVVIKGTNTGAATDANGTYQLTAPSNATIVFSSVGYQTQAIALAGQSVLNVVMSADVTQVDEVVVTALGISREKKSLGYATQEVKGDAISAVKSDNFINSLSGKVAGVSIKNNGNMGGSTNIVIRGSKSLYQSNQALFVIDGVPVDNSNTNNTGQIAGRSGYDYGNAASDLNPNDIESISVLKGSAATALYGSRASNGVIMITTKKGTKKAGKAVGVTVNSNVTFGKIDKSTFPTYQHSYGAGYLGYTYSDGEHGGLEHYADVDGDGEIDYTVPYYDDASMGEKFDPNLLVYQWDSFTPESPNYGKKTPWVAGANGPDTFFKTAMSYTNSVDVTGGTDKSTYRMSYTNLNNSGVMPNSSLKRNSLTFNGSYDILPNLKVSGSANYTSTDGKGRNSTGYSDNILSSFRQWYQVNTDVKMEKYLFDKTGHNVTWNRNAYNDATPAYWDNPYWVRYRNYETDERNRLIGYAQADWKASSWLSFMGRVSIDTYNELQEERKAVGSVSGELGVDRPDVTSGYSRLSRTFKETNVDLMANIKKDLTENINLTAVIGTNFRRSKQDQVFASTNGGLSVPDVYALSNSVDPMLPPEESLHQIGVNGYFASVSLGYKNMLFLDGTFRRDVSSTLPSDKWAYSYPSISGSFLFSELVEADWLSLGKVRLNYAEVGSGAPWGSVKDTYTPVAPYSGNPLVSVSGTKNNGKLRPEQTKSIEAGLAMNFFQNRVGFDVAAYKTNTVDLITPIQVSFATGYTFKYLNAGEMENRGVEIELTGAPVKTSDFSWNISVNWARNVNKVLKLPEGLKNLPINDGLQGGVSVNARVGEPYGTIQGTDYVYKDGKRIVKSNGYYQLSSTSDIVLGNINPDWTAGINNSFSYKNIRLAFLIDIQHGGDIFSLDQWYGQGTGLYPESVYINDLGNPVRNSVYNVPLDPTSGVSDVAGGLILDGVLADGTPNTKRVEGGDYRVWGWARCANSQFVYDASYVKLRELTLTYDLPKSLMQKTFIYGASISFVGSNLWIISKNLPYADPEAGQSAGNTQGWQSGVMPTVRSFGFTLNVQF